MEAEKEKRINRTLPIIVLILVTGALILLVKYLEYRATQSEIDYKSRIHVMSMAGSTTWDQPGATAFKVYNRWEKEEVSFYDYGFDGSLDMVSFYKGRDKEELDPNSPDWNIWVERYLETRTEATKG